MERLVVPAFGGGTVNLPPDRRRWVLRPSEIAAVDRAAIDAGLPGMALMESAGRGVAAAIVERWGRAGRARILVGKGNNGGDGLVVARTLAATGWEVEIAMFADPETLSDDAGRQWRLVAGLGLETVLVKDADQARNAATTGSVSCIVDALLGTGLSGEVREPMRTAIAHLADSGAPVVSVDAPSGLDGDTGRPLGVAVRARLTVTFGFPKPGLFLADGPAHCGRLIVVPLGYPAAALAAAPDVPLEWITLADAARSLPGFPRDAHKGSRGRLLLVVGSEPYRGAAVLTARAALRSGCGYCTVAAPASIASPLVAQLPEALVAPLPVTDGGALAPPAADAVRELATGADAVALGPGLSTGGAVSAVVRAALSVDTPAIVDADALNALADDPDAARRRAPTILTPHPGELGRWLGRSAQTVDADRIESAIEAAERWGARVVLKGWPTIIAEGPAAALNLTGNPGLATAGSGDLLTGLAGGLLAQGTAAGDVARVAPFLHGLAGDWAAADLGPRGVNPSELGGYIARTIREIAAGRGAALLARVDHPYRTLLAS